MAFASSLPFLAMSLVRPDGFAPELPKYCPMAVTMAIALPLALIQIARGKLTMSNITSWRHSRISAKVIAWCVMGLTALRAYSFYIGFDAQRYVL
ncbi:MAG: hypothetical protein M0037_11230 [Betaproteobacteria bacterium]|jgi:hypothetical protein|nr:hypothetical protein [Betaproteobacteria bacterium]